MQWIRGLQTQMNVCTFEVFYQTNAYLMHVTLLVYSCAQYNLEMLIENKCVLLKANILVSCQ